MPEPRPIAKFKIGDRVRMCPEESAKQPGFTGRGGTVVYREVSPFNFESMGAYMVRWDPCHTCGHGANDPLKRESDNTLIAE